MPKNITETKSDLVQQRAAYCFANKIAVSTDAKYLGLKQWLAELESGGWISVGDKLPELNRAKNGSNQSDPVMAYIDAGLPTIIEANYVYSDGMQYWYSPLLGEVLDSITHWMPIPNAPNKK